MTRQVEIDMELLTLGMQVECSNGREEETWMVKALQVVADLPAKAQLVNQMQYNGNYVFIVSEDN